jgi:hypothetical protein
VAAAIAYPELTTDKQRQDVLGSAGGSVAGFEELEKRFIFEITKLGAESTPAFAGWQTGGTAPKAEGVATLNNVSVTPSVVPPVEADGTFPSWRLLRVDVKMLTLQVNHHFDYRLDGHARKYQMHIESNSTKEWKVYLTRAHDKWRIPYNEINSITLIALLRMGILSEIKNWFYGLFLRLPMYEDMAPWNIVFRGGKLDYIDYDTKDHTLDAVLPFAYQIIAALMNYERTVNDFGHCKGHAKNEYGVGYVSHCVQSSFNGPCTESRYPVPCGDQSCRESYPACLLAMRKLEYDAQNSPVNSPAQISHAFTEEETDDLPKVGGLVVPGHQTGTRVKAGKNPWTYDRSGRVQEM